MTESGATPTQETETGPRAAAAHGWRWAIATLAVVAIILGATFAAHSVAARLRHPPATPAPPLPPLAVLAVTAPDADYELTALDASNGHIVALAADRQPQCPPQGACPAAPPLTRFVVLDGTAGHVLASTPLAGASAASATYLLADETSHLAYAVAPSGVTLFSTETGAVAGSVPFSAASSGAIPTGAAFDPTSRRLFVVEDGQLLAIQRFADDIVSTRHSNASAGSYSGLVLDARDGVLYTLHRDSTSQGATLLAIDATTLATVAQASLTTNATLGPIDPTTGAVSLLGADGQTYNATFASGQITLAAAGPANALANALALGWNPTLGHTYVAHDDDVQVLDASSGKPIAALPVRLYGGAALLADPTRNLLYLTANGGSLIIAQDAAAEPTAVPNAATAILLARAALANYLPDTNQDPPFLDTETFWPGATTPAVGGGASSTFARDFWIHLSDLGWTGPYAGSAATGYTPLAGPPNGYQVTFTITWQQLFRRTHTWTLDVAAGGDVSFVSDVGDALT